MSTAVPPLSFRVLFLAGPYWVGIPLSQVAHFSIHLTMTYSYPATANGPHQVEVALRRVQWYPAIVATCWLLPTLDAWLMHQHATIAVSDDIYYKAIFRMMSLNFEAFLFAVGLLLVDYYIGRRDRAIVKADPLTAKPKPKEDLNTEEAPPHLHSILERERFWLTMNYREEVRWTEPSGTCARCNTHSYRIVVKLNTLQELERAIAKKEAQYRADHPELFAGNTGDAVEDDDDDEGDIYDDEGDQVAAQETTETGPSATGSASDNGAATATEATQGSAAH